MSLLGDALAVLRPRRWQPSVAATPAATAGTTGDGGGDGRAADRALVLAVIGGSQPAFEQLVADHQRTCAQVIGKMVGDRDHVADLLQETFLAVYRQLHRFRFDSSLRTWISRVAYTTALQYLRRRRLETHWFVATGSDDLPEVGDGEPGPAELSQARQAGQWLSAALQRLTPAQRLIVTLHYVEEFDIGEIVQITGMPGGTIKSHLYRARQALKTDLLRRAPAGELL